jgi:hypothetical protein
MRPEGTSDTPHLFSLAATRSTDTLSTHRKTMNDPDEALTKLKQIGEEFAAFCKHAGEVSEADTRAKVIDQILTQVLGWPEAHLTREVHVREVGYIDYSLQVRGRHYVTVEAKREGKAFVFAGKRRHARIKGTLLTECEVKAAVEQARSYCAEEGIRYAIATNGYSWIVFRAMREDMPWRDGQAVVYPSFEDIAANFTHFWNLLSYEAISAGSLDAEFGSQIRMDRRLYRVVDRLWNADQPLQRNRLHIRLLSLVSAVFEDIADQAQLEILRECYIHSRSLHIVARELGVVMTDEIPQFLRAEGAFTVHSGEHDAGAFGSLVQMGLATDKGYLCLLLGGIGSGKTTFLKRFQRLVGKEILEKKTVWFSIDFLRAPLDPQELEPFVWRNILKQLRERYASEKLEARRNLKNIYKEDIYTLEETVLRHAKRHTEEYEKILSPYLEKWQSDIADYVPRLLAATKPHRGIKTAVFIDNVDQLSPAYQAQIFLLAQRITGKIGSVTIVALREESYYTASVQKTFTAYTNHRFHIASPKFLPLIRNRIDYSRGVLKNGGCELELDLVPTNTEQFIRDDIGDFLKVVEDGVLEQSKVIVHFIEALCFGNMRLALQMFTTFLSSGATDVDKMLRIYRRDGYYQIAYHEFVKSIMLGERKYFKESSSPILNVFDCGTERNSSHFTALRILHLLVQYRGQSTPEGRGYFGVGRTISLFEELFDNREDVIKTLNRLVARQLVEVDTRSPDSIVGAAYARVTSAGWYYLTRLVRSFVYLDLVMQDTPLNDEALMNELRDSVYRVDNLNDTEEDKLLRVNARFERVERFLGYLTNEEDRDAVAYGLDARDTPLSHRFVADIAVAFGKQRERIGRRIAENREKFIEDTFIRLSEADTEVLSSLIDEDVTSDEVVESDEDLTLPKADSTDPTPAERAASKPA